MMCSIYRLAVLAYLPFGLFGCASTFDTRPFDKALDSKGINNGITYYESKMAIVRYVFTQLVDKDGNVKGDSRANPPSCTELVQKDDIQFLPDFSKPMVVIQHPSQFGQSQLQVGFNSNGTLSSLNSVSQPSSAQLLATLETAAKDKVLPFASPQAGAACNAAPVIKTIRFIEKLGDLTQ